MKVSFDFDGTLDSPIVQEYAKELIRRGVEVHLVTSRRSEEYFMSLFPYKPEGSFSLINEDLFAVAEQVGIPVGNIHFTNGIYKAEFFSKNKDFIWHLDDILEEIEFIAKTIDCLTIPVYVLVSDFKEICEELIEGCNER